METRQRIGGKLLLISVVISILCLSILFIQPAKAATSVTITFRDYKGQTNTYYESLTKKVTSGSSVKLPGIPTLSNYESIGWALQEQSETAKYKAGATITVQKNITLYAAYKLHPCLITYLDNDGSSNDAFKKLNCRLPIGGTIKFPSLPAKSGYTALGWTTQKGAATAKYKPGSTARTGASHKMYAVYKKNAYCTLNFYDQDGSYNNTYLALNRRVLKNGSTVLPTVKNKTGYTFLGWSSRHGQSSKPEYQSGSSFKVLRNQSLYAVWFKTSSEKKLSKSELPRLNTNKYAHAILVGDSRTYLQQQILKYEFGTSAYANITYIAKTGSGLSWLKTTGHTELINTLKKYHKGRDSKPIAIVFNHGVNDLQNLSSYVSYMKSLATELKPYNCKLFYLSVNPLNSEVLFSRNVFRATEKQVLNFNAQIKSKLAGSYAYLDSHTRLIQTGYSLDRNINGYDSGYDDGLHYSAKTEKRIFNFVINSVNNAL